MGTLLFLNSHVGFTVMFFLKVTRFISELKMKICYFVFLNGMFQSIGPWEAWINFQFASCLFAHSIDRLIVVCYPLSYFANQSKIVAALVVFSFIPATLAITVLIIREFSLAQHTVNRMCR